VDRRSERRRVADEDGAPPAIVNRVGVMFVTSALPRSRGRWPSPFGRVLEGRREDDVDGSAADDDIALLLPLELSVA